MYENLCQFPASVVHMGLSLFLSLAIEISQFLMIITRETIRITPVDKGKEG